jgi:hypothetical protein
MGPPLHVNKNVINNVAEDPVMLDVEYSMRIIIYAMNYAILNKYPEYSCPIHHYIERKGAHTIVNINPIYQMF